MLEVAPSDCVLSQDDYTHMGESIFTKLLKTVKRVKISTEAAEKHLHNSPFEEVYCSGRFNFPSTEPGSSMDPHAALSYGQCLTFALSGMADHQQYKTYDDFTMWSKLLHERVKEKGQSIH